MKYADEVRRAVRRALIEDVGCGDVTSRALIPSSRIAAAAVVVQGPGVVCGLDAAAETFHRVDRRLRFVRKVRDGARVGKGRIAAEVRGPLRSILTGERVALNFIQHLSGVATLTRAFADRIRGFGARVVDTRKTVPGLRLLQKRAVALGGGTNHRMGLYDAGLVKDNHIAAGPDLEGGLRRLRRSTRWIQIEAATIDQAERFARLPVDSILLDNFSPRSLAKAVRRIRRIRPRLILEASGGVTLKTVRAIARSGVDRISVGALTHSAPALDVSLDVIA